MQVEAKRRKQEGSQQKKDAEDEKQGQKHKIDDFMKERRITAESRGQQRNSDAMYWALYDGNEEVRVCRRTLVFLSKLCRLHDGTCKRSRSAT
jgi:hypothetical protein